MRPYWISKRPNVEVPSPTAINAGPSLKLVDVEASFDSAQAESRTGRSRSTCRLLAPLTEDASQYAAAPAIG